MSEEKTLQETLHETMSEEWDKSVAEKAEKEAEEEPEEKEEVPPESPEQPEEAPEPAEEPEEAPEPVEEEKTPWEAGDLQPLEHWTNEDKASFGKMPKEAQEFLISKDKKFQAHYTRKLQEVAEIRRALEPARAEMQYFGVSEADAIRRLVGAHKMLQEKPHEAIRFIADTYGIDLGKSMAAEPRTEDSAALTEVRSIRQEMANRERQALQGRVMAWEKQIDIFKKDHEFFEEVEPAMTRIAEGYATRGEDIPALAELYDQAVYADPTVRQRALARDRSAEDRKRIEAEKAAAKKARRAVNAKVHGSSTATEERPKSGKTLHDDLSAAWDKANEKPRTM
jgi:hypothetical protein